MEEGFHIPVSVIIPVHNSIEYLPMTIGSLLAQTLENIEIILVENGSTDGADDLLDKYAQEHKNIVVKHIPPQTCPGPGRNEGTKIARGEYVYFCDSDDYVYPDALQRMYEVAVISGADLVMGAIAYTYDEGKTVVARNLYKPGMTRTQYMNKQFCSVWEKLVKKTLLDRTPAFMPLAFEDVMWSYQVISLAEKIVHVRKPVYLWYRREGTVSSTSYSKYMETIAEAEESLYNDLNPECLEAVEFFMARRARWQMKYRWYVRDLQIASIKRFWSRYSNNRLVREDDGLFNYLKNIAELPDTSIPKRIYIGGFREKDTSETTAYFQQRAFRDPCEVVILSEENCDINENATVRSAWENGDSDLAERYFAAKRIYEEGGIYCNSDMRFNAPMNCLLHLNAFFAFSSTESLSDDIFGGRAGSDVFAALLETFVFVESASYSSDTNITEESFVTEESEMDEENASEFDGTAQELSIIEEDDENFGNGDGQENIRNRAQFMDSSFSFAIRIDIVLFNEFNVKKNGKSKRYKDGLAVYAPQIMMYDLFHPKLGNDAKMQISWNAKDIFADDKGYVTLSGRAVDYYREREETNSKNLELLKKDLNYLKKNKKYLSWMLSKRNRLRSFIKKTPLYPVAKFALDICKKVKRRLKGLKK